MQPDAKPLGIIELLTRIGEEHVGVQNLVESATNFRARGKGRDRHTAITFLTDQITPTDVMRDTMPRVGLVIWLPTELVEQARKDHAAAAENGAGTATREPPRGHVPYGTRPPSHPDRRRR